MYKDPQKGGVQKSRELPIMRNAAPSWLLGGSGYSSIIAVLKDLEAP